MQQLVRLMAVRLAQILLIELLDIRVLMRLTDGLRLVLSVQTRSTRSARIDVQALEGLDDRLAAAVDAAARAGHDLDEGVVRLAGLDAVDELLGSTGAVRNSRLDLNAADPVSN